MACDYGACLDWASVYAGVLLLVQDGSWPFHSPLDRQILVALPVRTKPVLQLYVATEPGVRVGVTT